MARRTLRTNLAGDHWRACPSDGGDQEGGRAKLIRLSQLAQWLPMLGDSQA